jgi:hypothetical protein
MWDWISQRIKEPSTWVGLGSLVTAVGWQFSPELWQAIAAVGMGVGGLLAVLVKEKKV